MWVATHDVMQPRHMGWRSDNPAHGDIDLFPLASDTEIVVSQYYTSVCH